MDLTSQRTFSKERLRFGRDVMILAFTFLSFAIANGFPLYYSDSSGYDGHVIALGTIRAWTLSALARPLWPLIGPWATPLINSIVLAIVLVRFQRSFLSNIGMLSTSLIVFLSGAPFYTSSIMADIWIVTGLLALTIAAKDGSILFGLIAVVAITMHGGHIYVLSVAAVVLIVLSADRARVLTRVAAVMIVALCVIGSARLVASKAQHLNWALPTARLLNDIPDLLPAYCARWPEDNLCVARRDVEAILNNGKDSDDKVIWNSPVFDRNALINFTSLNHAGPRLLFLAVTQFPSTLAVKTYLDLKYVVLDGCLGFSGWWKPVSFIAEIQAREPPMTLAKSGFFTRPDICKVVRASRYVLYGVAGFSLVYILVCGTPTHRLVTLTSIAAVVANLIFYITLGGAVGRHHFCAVLLLGIMALAAWDTFLQNRRS